MAEDTTGDVRRTYDTIAGEYGRRIADELAHKPFDRERLTQFAGRVRGRGPVWELGCGPGHIAAFLISEGADVVGFDLSSAMIAEAHARHPDMRFCQADFAALPEDERRPSGIVAFYSLIHLPPDRVLPVLQSWRRLLLPGGHLLIAVHVGDRSIHLDEWWGRAVSIDTWFFDPAWLCDTVAAAGFIVQDLRVREPYPDVEYPSRRAYLAATTPV